MAAVRSRRRRRILIAIPVVLLLLMLLWDWNWLRPLVESSASSALGREVRMQRFDIDLGWHPVIKGDGIVIANPEGFPADSRFGSIERLRITVDFWSLFSGVPRIPRIAAERFDFDLRPNAEGKPNWKFEREEPKKKEKKEGPAVRIGSLDLREGRVHVVHPAQKSDFQLAVRTEGQGDAARLRVDAEGTYAGQPITGRFIGGSVLNLQKTVQPYPVDLEAVNGQTRVSLKGSIEDPLQLGGAQLDLVLRGDDLEELFPLTGIPLPPTPAYELKGALELSRERISFRNFRGVVGSSDMSGDLTVDLAREKKRLITAVLHSDKLSMVDLAGFVGAAPGKEGKGGDTQDQQQMRAEDQARPRVLPDRTISLPKIRAADLDIRFRGKRIESDWLPLDNLDAHLVIEDGYVRVTPLRFGVGQGQIAANIEMDGRKDVVQTEADVDFRRLDLNRIMQETRVFEGAGVIGGVARLRSRGNSLADMLGQGDGELKLFMTQGELSALLVNLAGLEFGNALLSALGLPRKTEIRCLVTDLDLEDGVLKTRTMLLDTEVSNLFVSGTINLQNEALDLQLRAQPKRFGLATFKAPINIDGTMKEPDLGIEADELGARGGAAAALSAVLGPLAALVPTIDLGLGKDHDCKALIESVGAAESALKRGGVPPPPNGTTAAPKAPAGKSAQTPPAADQKGRRDEPAPRNGDKEKAPLPLRPGS